MLLALKLKKEQEYDENILHKFGCFFCFIVY